MSGLNLSAHSCKSPTAAVTRERLLSHCGKLRAGFFTPSALGLLGLALMVMLLGFGSRPFPCSSPAENSGPHILKVRMCAEDRPGADVVASHATALNLKARVYANAGAFTPIAVSHNLVLREVSGVLVIAGRPRSIPFFHSAIPLRSPPSISL